MTFYRVFFYIVYTKSIVSFCLSRHFFPLINKGFLLLFYYNQYQYQYQDTKILQLQIPILNQNSIATNTNNQYQYFMSCRDNFFVIRPHEPTNYIVCSNCIYKSIAIIISSLASLKSS